MLRELAYLGIDPGKIYGEFTLGQMRNRRKAQPVLRKIGTEKRRSNKKRTGNELEMEGMESSSELEEGEIR